MLFCLTKIRSDYQVEISLNKIQVKVLIYMTEVLFLSLTIRDSFEKDDR